MIPWLVALLALFGCTVVASPNVVLSNAALIDDDGDSASQIVNEGATVLSVKRYIPSIVNGSAKGLCLRLPVLQRIDFDPCEEHVVLTRLVRVVQGRAPPLGVFC
jgi:hypothetical protein